MKDIRAEIDRIDSELIPLLKARFECSKKVAEYKRANNMKVLDSTREAEILEKVKALGGENIAEIYKCIMAQSRAVQEEMAK